MMRSATDGRTAEDESLLASLLVLLLRSSFSSSAADEVAPKSKLQNALEKNDCQLLVFIGRLITAYNTAIKQYDDAVDATKKCYANDEDTSNRHYAFLRLAIHVAYIRYTEITSSDDNGNCETNSSNNINCQLVLECEKYLMRTLLPQTLHVRASLDINEVDVEIALILRGLLSKQQPLQSSLTTGSFQLWTDLIDSLLERRRMHRQNDDGSTNTKKSATTTTTESTSTHEHVKDNNDDNDLIMVQTIHSILDGKRVGAKEQPDENLEVPSNKDSKATTSNSVEVEWSLDFDNVIVDSLQSFLQHVSAAATASGDSSGGATPIGSSIRLKQSALFRMIQMSQQHRQNQSNAALLVHVYWSVLQYLRSCMQHSNHSMTSINDCFVVSAQGDCDDKQSQEGTITVAAAIRSFIFYGMVVLGNTVAASSNMQNDSTSQEEYLSSSSSISQLMPLKGLRADIYTIAVDIWRLFGPDWLYYDSNSLSSTTTNNDFWWFRTTNIENQLGSTWPLCTFVQLAAGDLRLNLGRWITVVEDGNVVDSSTDANTEYICSEIQSCANIILETVQLMTRLVDDDKEVDGGASGDIWMPEGLLNIRQSLEDALNSSIQYLNSSQAAVSSDQAGEVGKVCCVLVGAIASELEIEDLLISPSIDERNMQLTKEADSSCFASALGAGISLCNTVGEANIMNSDERLETCEPLCCLLPCIMSVVSSCSSSSNERVQIAASSLCKEGHLMDVISQFIHRALKHWKRLDRSFRIDEVFATLPIIGLCVLIVEELVTSSATIGDYEQLRSSMNGWKNELSNEIESEVAGLLKEDIAQTLQQVSNCLIILETYQ